MEVEIEVLVQRNDEEADDLVSTNEVDDMANEQTWPTEEELNTGALATGGESLPDAKKGTTPKAVRKVPKGTSAYQAAWLIDEDGEGGSEGEWSDTASDDGEKPHLSFNFAGGDSAKEERDAEDDVAVPLPADEEEMEELTEEMASKAARFEDMDLDEEAKQFVPNFLPSNRPCNTDCPPYQVSNHGANEKRTMPHICSSRTRSTLLWMSMHEFGSSDAAV